MDRSIPPEVQRAAALGDRLTRLLDERRALENALVAIDAEIYEELVNRLQSQIGAVLGPLEARIIALEAQIIAMQRP